MIARLAQFVPPAPNTFYSKGRRIAGDAQIDPSGVRRDVIHTVGRNLAKFWKDEVVYPHRLWLTARP
jgi:hypothetical protein